MSLLCSALYQKSPYYVLLYMLSVLIIWCFICQESLLFSALYVKSPYYLVLYMPRVLIIWYFKCKVSLLFGAFKKCKVSLLFGALNAKCPYLTAVRDGAGKSSWVRWPTRRTLSTVRSTPGTRVRVHPVKSNWPIGRNCSHTTLPSKLLGRAGQSSPQLIAEISQTRSECLQY